MRAEELKAEGRLLIDPEAPVEASHLIMLLDEVIAGGDQAQASFSTDVAFEAQDADVSVLVQKLLDVRALGRIIAFVLAEIARRVVRSEQKSEIVAPAPPRQFERVIGIYDRARVHGLQRRLKKVNPF